MARMAYTGERPGMSSLRIKKPILFHADPGAIIAVLPVQCNSNKDRRRR